MYAQYTSDTLWHSSFPRADYQAQEKLTQTQTYKTDYIKGFDRKLTVKRSQQRSCSATYKTLTQNQV